MPQIIGNVTIQTTAPGADDTIAKVERISSVMGQLVNQSKSLSDAFSSSLISKDAKIAEMAVSAAQTTYQSLSQTLKENNNDLDKMSTEDLLKFEELNNLVKNLNKSLLDSIVNEKDLFTAEEVKIIGEMSGGLKELLPTIQNILELRTKLENISKQNNQSGIKEIKRKEQAYFELGDTITNKLIKPMDILKSVIGSVLKSEDTKKAFGSLIDGFKTAITAGGTFANQIKNIGLSIKARGGLKSSIEGSLEAFIKMRPLLLGLTASITIFVAAFGGILVALKVAVDAFTQLLDIQEKYRTNNYRAAGSINELSEATAQLGSSTFLGTGQAYEAIDSLVKMGFTAETLRKGFTGLNGEMVTGIDALKDMAEITMKVAHATGVGVEVLARFQKSIVAMGGGADTAGRILGDLLNAQEDYGLATEDLTSILSTMVENQALLQVGFTKTDPAKFSKALGELHARARQAGLGIATVTNMINKLKTGMDKTATTMAVFAGRLGDYINTGDLTERMEIFQSGVKGFVQAYGSLPTGIFLSIGENMGLTVEQIKLAQYELGELRGQEAEMYKEKAAMAAINERFATSTNTVIQQLEMAFKPVMSMAAEALIPFTENLTGLITNVREWLIPLWVEVQLLIENIFGFDPGQATISGVIEAVINGMTAMVRIGNVVVDVFQAIIEKIEKIAKKFDDMPMALKAMVAPTATLFDMFSDKSPSEAIAIAAGVAEEESKREEERIRRITEAREALHSTLEKENEAKRDAENLTLSQQAAALAEKVKQGASVWGNPFQSSGVADYYQNQGLNINQMIMQDVARRGFNIAAANSAIIPASPSRPDVGVTELAVNQTAPARSSSASASDVALAESDQIAELVAQARETNTLLAAILEAQPTELLEDIADAYKTASNFAGTLRRNGFRSSTSPMSNSSNSWGVA